MSMLSREQKLEIIDQALAADAMGDHDRATSIRKQLPLAPHLAIAAKEAFGKEFFLDRGYDLSAAEAEYGKDWLDR